MYAIARLCVSGGWDRIVMTEIREDWAAKARENVDTCFEASPTQHEDAQQNVALPSRIEVHAHDATLPFSQLRAPVSNDKAPTEVASIPAGGIGTTVAQPALKKGRGLAPGEVDAVVMNPPWGKRIGNLSLENADDGAIVRSLLAQFVRHNQQIARICIAAHGFCSVYQVRTNDPLHCNVLMCMCISQKNSVFVIIAPSLDACVQGYTGGDGSNSGKTAAENTGVDGWDVLHAVKVGGKILMHVLVPKTAL